MSTVAESLESESTASAEDERSVGIVTRAVSWVVDAVLIDLAAIMAGVGAALILSIFPLAKNLDTAAQAFAGAAYVLWAAVYFVVFWSITGQTPGARVMQIRLVTAKHTRVKPARALVRWVGMNLAMLPLFAGYIPILFGRRGFPDWLAKTLVLDTPQLSLAEARRASGRATRDGLQALPATPPKPAASSPPSGDGGAGGLAPHESSRRHPR